MSDKSSATGVVALHPVPDHRLQSWIERATEAAQSMPGFESLRLSGARGGLATEVAAAFDTAEHLHAWLDSSASGPEFRTLTFRVERDGMTGSGSTPALCGVDADQGPR